MQAYFITSVKEINDVRKWNDNSSKYACVLSMVSNHDDRNGGVLWQTDWICSGRVVTHSVLVLVGKLRSII